MGIAELLLNTAAADRDLLQTNREHGDNPDTPRDLEFVLYAKTVERAELVRDFITDNGYGRPTIREMTGGNNGKTWRLLVAIRAPATEHVACSLSGFMACLSKLYDLEYDGWGCLVQKAG
jgi:hypothetical protein